MVENVTPAEHDGNRVWRQDAALAALGRLTPAEAAAVEAATSADPARRLELAELRSAAAALTLAEVPEGEPPRAPASVPDRVLDAVAGHRRRRTRIAASLAGAAAAAAVLVVALVVTGPADATRVPFSEVPPGVTATFVLHANGSGTAVDLEVDGLAEGVYWLWLTDAGGERTSAGTFRQGDAETELVLQAALPVDTTHRVWVTDADDSVVLDAVLDGSAVPGY